MILKELRKQKNLSQAELAKAINVSQKSISDYEMGKTEPDIETLIKLARCFHTTIDNLVGYEVPYLLDKSILSPEQNELIDKIIELSREQCMFVTAYIEGLKIGQEKRENVIKKIKGE